MKATKTIIITLLCMIFANMLHAQYAAISPITKTLGDSMSVTFKHVQDAAIAGDYREQTTGT